MNSSSLNRWKWRPLLCSFDSGSLIISWINALIQSYIAWDFLELQCIFSVQWRARFSITRCVWQSVGRSHSAFFGVHGRLLHHCSCPNTWLAYFTRFYSLPLPTRTRFGPCHLYRCPWAWKKKKSYLVNNHIDQMELDALFSRVHATLQPAPLVVRSVGPSVRNT